MRPYRCYFLDAHGAIAGVHVLVCADDREASVLAPELLAQRPEHSGLEVWDRSRRIAIHTADPRHV
jgi:hypothetical protein